MASATILITRDVEERYRGFLLSCMSEVAQGVYVSSSLNAAARRRVWDVIVKWHDVLRRGSVTIIYQDGEEPSGLRIDSVGTPRRTLVDFNGVYGTRTGNV